MYFAGIDYPDEISAHPTWTIFKHQKPPANTNQ